MSAVAESSVLVLNSFWEPVNVTTVRRAFSLLYQGIARAIDNQYQMFDFASWSALSAEVNGDAIRTIYRAFRVPRVILLTAYDRMPRNHVRFSRHNIFARDRDTCQYCGAKLPRSEFNIDHVIPRSLGGTSTWENVVTSCMRCNIRKGGRTPSEAGMRLIRKPATPRWTPLWRAADLGLRYEQWKPFLSLVDASYWNVELLE